MGLKTTKRKIEKNRSKMAAIQAILDELEKEERGQENADIVKKIRKDLDYAEFIAFWEESQKHRNELLERHKRKEGNKLIEEKNNSDIDGSADLAE